MHAQNASKIFKRQSHQNFFYKSDVLHPGTILKGQEGKTYSETLNREYIERIY